MVASDGGLVAWDVADALARAGLIVCVASSSLEALLQACQRRFDVLIIDESFNDDLEWVETAVGVGALSGAKAVLLDSAAEPRRAIPQALRFDLSNLAKPFTQNALLDSVAAALSRRAARSPGLVSSEFGADRKTA